MSSEDNESKGNDDGSKDSKSSRRGGLPIKGPEKLPIEMIRDIVNSRAIPHARDVLSKKHGISINRIDKLWREYYGGHTMTHYKSGLKKPLPDGGGSLPSGRTRSSVAGKRKVMAEEPAVRAQPARVLQKINKKPPELDTDNLADADDSTADIISGEIQQGNDNEDLIEAMYALIETNKDLSESARTNLETARDYYEKTKRKYKKLRGHKISARNYKTTINNGNDTTATDTDAECVDNGYDSTKVGTSAHAVNYADNVETEDEYNGYDDNEQDIYEPIRGQHMELSRDSGRAPVSVYRGESGGPVGAPYAGPDSVRYAERSNSINRYSSQTPRGEYRSRAKPTYRFGLEPSEPEYEERSASGRGPYRAGAEVPTPQRGASARGIQQNNTLHDTQLRGQSGQRAPVHPASAQGPGGNRPALVRPI